MNETSDTILKKFYQKLYDNIERENKLVGNSVIISLLDILKTNTRFKLLSNSKISKYSIPGTILHDLINKNLIAPADEPNTYVISAKGVLQFEKDALQHEAFSEYLSKRIFNVFLTKKLKPKEKVVLLAVIAVRAFSEESQVNIKQEGSGDVWKEILDESYEKLRALQLIPVVELYGNYGGNVGPVYGLFNHVNHLQKKTKGLYTAPGKQKYFLDISDGSEVSREKLDYLFKQIWGEKQLSPTELEDLYKFCCRIASDKHIYIFESGNIFSKPKYDDVIRDAIFSWDTI